MKDWKDQLNAIKDTLGFVKSSEVEDKDKSKPKVSNKPKAKQKNDLKKVKAKKSNKRSKPKHNQNNTKQKANFVDKPIALIGCTNARKNNHSNVSEKQMRKSTQPEFQLPAYKKPDRSAIKSAVFKVVDSLPAFTSFNQGASDEVYLHIGLDFGTAYTKVVIGDESDAYAVSFENYGYLLPSIVYLDKHGVASLTAKAGSRALSELKMPIILGEATQEDHLAILMFLALVFQVIREWPNTEAQSPYKNQSIEWLINAGIPAANYENTRLLQCYQRLICGAWTLSYCRTISVEAAHKIAKQLDSGSSAFPEHVRFDRERLMLLPEFAAQIVGYVQSPQRRKFSHLLVDVGAGTLDVAMFTIDEKHGEWVYKTYDQNVKTLGADVLLKHRISHCPNNTFSVVTSPEKFPDDREFVDLMGISVFQLLQIDESFLKEVSSCIYKTINTTNHQYAGGPGKFTENITTFLCGGGMHIPLYSEAVEKVRKRGNYPLQVVKLPKPERLRTKLDNKDYHRLSVAYGLSYDSFNIGEVIKQKAEQYKREVTIRENTYMLFPK